MGNSLSVSSTIDRLHALPSEERSAAFDELCEQHEELRTYLKSKSDRLPQKENSRPPPLHIKSSVPDDQRLTTQEYSAWSQDISLFWKKSPNWLAEEDTCDPICMVYNATSRFRQSCDYRDCLRSRYITLFWFDYFKSKYPDRETGYDSEYEALGCKATGSANTCMDVPILRKLVKAGRRYNMLTTKFGDGILLTIPPSIARSKLEEKLPLDRQLFDAWIQLVVGNIWVEEAKTKIVIDLGSGIRKYLLQLLVPSIARIPTTITSPGSPTVCSAVQRNQYLGDENTTRSSHVTSQPIAASVDRNVSSPTPRSSMSLEAFIPPLLYAMGSQVPSVILDRAIMPQSRWNCCGKIDKITLCNADLHHNFVHLISNETKFKEGIEDLISRSIINKGVSKAGLQTYSCQGQPARHLYDRDRAQWIHYAFKLCCYVFPRDQYLDSSFGIVGRQLLRIVQHVLGLYAGIGIAIPPGRESVETLVAASSFGDWSSQHHLLTVASTLHPKEPDLLATIVHRQSVLLRLQKKVSNSQDMIQGFLAQQQPLPDPRLHSLLGLLHLSQAENWAYNFDYKKVYFEAQKWELGDNPSLMQLHVFQTKLKVLGQSYKGDGFFLEAESAYKGWLETTGPHDSSRFLIKSNLADVYCELAYLHHKHFIVTDSTYLNKAEAIVKPEIEYLRAHGRRLRPFRRMLLSLIEVQLLRGRYDMAESLIEELLVLYDELTEPNVNDQVGHVRACIAWARISPPCLTAARWSQALSWNKKYNPSEDDVFTCGVIHLFISISHLESYDFDNSQANFIRAAAILSSKKPQFLIPGIGTYLYDFARQRSRWQTTARLDGLYNRFSQYPFMSTSRSEGNYDRVVAFDTQPSIRHIEPRTGPRRSRVKMEKLVFEKYDGAQVTEGMLQQASKLFNENYGVWGEQAAAATGKVAKEGSRVCLSKQRLRHQCLPDNTICSYVRVIVGDELAGNAFACRWNYNDISVCWITQLVVDRNYRERGLAMGLLNQLRQDDIGVYGLMSSHPAACLAAAKAFGVSIDKVRLGFIRDHAEAIMAVSPINYVKKAKPCGSVFTPEDTSGLVSCVNTGFFVDHTEPLEALAWVRQELDWPLGDLLDGHEFLFILEARRRARSRSLSTSRPRD